MNNSSTVTTETTMAPLAIPGTYGHANSFLKALNEYILTDIQVLEEIGRKPEVFGRCTTALAALCFSTIEQLGFVLCPNLDAAIAAKFQHGYAKEKIDIFCDVFISAGITEINKSELRDAQDLFRNKIVHNLLPVNGLGISQSISNGIDQIRIDDHGTKHLNVNYLSSIVKKAIAILITEPTKSTYVSIINRNVPVFQNAFAADISKYPNWL